MENATKALLIAGSVLIAIVLIAVGIKILGSTQGVTGQVDNVSDTMAKSIFNSQFQQYDGIQKGSVVKTLFSKVVANNANTEDGKSIIFSLKYNSSKTATGIAQVIATPNDSSTYQTRIQSITAALASRTDCYFKVEAWLGDDGYVYRMEVKEQ